MEVASRQEAEFPSALVHEMRKVTDGQAGCLLRDLHYPARSSRMIKPDERTLLARHSCDSRGNRCNTPLLLIMSAVGAAAWPLPSKRCATGILVWERYPCRKMRSLWAEQEHQLQASKLRCGGKVIVGSRIMNAMTPDVI